MTFRPRPPRGFLIMDSVVALAIALAILVMLTAALAHQSRAESHLAELRASARAAEAALFQLQSGKPLPEGVTSQTLPDPAPNGFAWVKVTVPPTLHAPGTSLTGLAPLSPSRLLPAPIQGGTK